MSLWPVAWGRQGPPQAASHGPTWSTSDNLSRSDGKRFIAQLAEIIHKGTGQQPVGWNAFFMRNTVHILETLQALGFVYHIDEPAGKSRSSFR